MKITGGKARGRAVLIPSQTRGLRPTCSKVREAVFNILGNSIEGARFVDLFAGSGMMGLEALSRGAGFVVFVEKNQRYAQMIKETVSKMDLFLKSKIVISSALSFLKQTHDKHILFDIIFIDPPYHTKDLGSITAFLSNFNPVKKDGVILVEHFHKTKLPAELSQSLIHRVYRYGDNSISFYKRGE